MLNTEMGLTEIYKKQFSGTGTCEFPLQRILTHILIVANSMFDKQYVSVLLNAACTNGWLNFRIASGKKMGRKKAVGRKTVIYTTDYGRYHIK